MDGARLTIFGVAVVSVACAKTVPGDDQDARVFFEKKDSEVVTCRVSLFLNSTQTIDWRTTDSRVMKELILDPLSKAKPDPMPARYVILGNLTITRKDGSEEDFTLFDPWGNVKRKDAYLIADLRPLAKPLKKALQDAIRRIE